MADCHSTNFDIAVSGQAAPYGVRATYGALAAESYLDADSREPAWRRRGEELAPTGAPRGAARLAETGVSLFQTLFHDRVRDLWLRALADLASGQGAAIRLRLSLTPSAVAALPWEALQDPDGQAPLAVSPQTPVVRMANLLGNVGGVRTLAATLPLRVLVVLPDDPSGQIDGASEWAAIHAALSPVAPEGITLNVLRGHVELPALRQTLTAQQPHIVHIVTHGQPEGLLFWTDGQPTLASSQALTTLLGAAPALRLVLLNACASGQSLAAPGDGEGLTALGAQLLQSGLPAVIAMQFAVGAAAARRFGEVFYQELLTGRCPGQIDHAMSAARSSLFLADQETFSYGTPVLWLNAPDGRIFAADGPLRRHPARALPTPADLAALDAQLAAVREWLTAQAGMDLPSAMTNAQLRSLLAQRREHMRWVEDRLSQFAVQPDAAGRAESAQAAMSEIHAHMQAADNLAQIIQANQE